MEEKFLKEIHEKMDRYTKNAEFILVHSKLFKELDKHFELKDDE